jgi:hypothetical protein
MTDEELREILRQQGQRLDLVLNELGRLHDGQTMVRRQIDVLQTQVRAIRTALNDMATLHPTSGEIEALHEDVNQVQANYTELGTRLATVERRLDELNKQNGS